MLLWTHQQVSSLCFLYQSCAKICCIYYQLVILLSHFNHCCRHFNHFCSHHSLISSATPVSTYNLYIYFAIPCVIRKPSAYIFNVTFVELDTTRVTYITAVASLHVSARSKPLHLHYTKLSLQLTNIHYNYLCLLYCTSSCRVPV